jgi:hypothetical protein
LQISLANHKSVNDTARSGGAASSGHPRTAVPFVRSVAVPQTAPAPIADRPAPDWADEAPPGELSIREHAEAIALVQSLRPYCVRWVVELGRPEIAPELGFIVAGAEPVPAWAIYRLPNGLLHFEDLAAGQSYTFGSMSAGLRFVRAVLESAADRAETAQRRGEWWEGLPEWLLTD